MLQQKNWDFFGNYNELLTFKDLNAENVHNNVLLPKAQRTCPLRFGLR